MLSNMQMNPFDLEPSDDLDLLERQERCQKALRAVGKAIVMRLFICVLLAFIVFRSGMELWVVAMLILVMFINVTGILPLAAEWRNRRQEWKILLDEENKNTP